MSGLQLFMRVNAMEEVKCENGVDSLGVNAVCVMVS